METWNLVFLSLDEGKKVHNVPHYSVRVSAIRSEGNNIPHYMDVPQTPHNIFFVEMIKFVDFYVWMHF